jgi:hypothetical protein
MGISGAMTAMENFLQKKLPFILREFRWVYPSALRRYGSSHDA